MIEQPPVSRKWNEGCNALDELLDQSQAVFKSLFDNSADPIWLFDPQTGAFVDCNSSAVALMRAPTKGSLLQAQAHELCPERQSDGRLSAEKIAEVSSLVEQHGSHRFEWLARRLDGTEVPLDIASTRISTDNRILHVAVARDISDRKKMETDLRESESRFRQFFERSADAMSVFDPATGLFVAANRASAELVGVPNVEALIGKKVADLSPERQPDGQLSQEKAAAIVTEVRAKGSHRYEWLLRRADGRHVPIEIVSTNIELGERLLTLLVSRDITERKKAENEVREFSRTLERSVDERTVELVMANRQLEGEIEVRRKAESALKNSEERLRTLVEHAPEAIVVFDADSSSFVSCNENASRLYGLSREAILAMTPADVSPPFQPGGQLSPESAREKIRKALDGQPQVFEWMHRHSSGRLVPCEVRLIRLPSEGRRLVRGSIIDNSERHRREAIQRAVFQISEAVHMAGDLGSFYRRIHEIIKELMPAQNFYIALFDPATEIISFPYFVDELETKPHPKKLTEGLTSIVLRTGQPMLVDRHVGARKHSVAHGVVLDAVPAVPYVEVGAPAAVWLGVPLMNEGRPVGVMAVQDYHNDLAYGEEDKRLLTFVASQTALAIERKRSQEDLRERTERVLRHRNALLELAQMDKSNFDWALERICTLAVRAMAVARASFWSLQDDHAAIRCETLCGAGRAGTVAEAKGTVLSKESCPAYFDALTSHEPIVAHDAVSHPATNALAESYLQPLGITSMLDAPVWMHGKVVGVVCHEHIGPRREWTPEEVDFAASLATMVSLSIEAAQRARSEQALRESERKFRALFETSGQGVMIHDEEHFIEVNPAAVRIMGYERAEDLLGKHPKDSSPPTQPNGESSEALSRKFIAQCLEQGSARFDWIARSGKGQDVPLEVILTRVEMDGRWLIQAVISDISERKKAEAELLKALAREKELSQLKSNFVSMVSHEFRTPLGIIMSSSEILRDYLERLDPTERQEHLDSISKSTKRMSEMMEEVLVLGRLDAGKMNFEPTPIDLPGLCRRIVDEVHSATDRRCLVELQADSLPSDTAADERLLRHVFANLLTNAIKYSEPGQTVCFRLTRERHDAVFVVQDRGIGIPEADQQWLCRAFHRGRNVGQRQGTGLGLLIVQRCVELHGGRLEIASRVGEGTTVTVRLPLFAN